MKRSSTLFLRLAVFAIGAPVLALCVLLLPKIADSAIQEAMNGAWLGYVVIGLLLIMYGSALPFYLALYQTLKLLGYIDKNESFSEMSVRALTKIKIYAILISGLYIAALPGIYIIAEWDDAPGLILIGLVISGASLVIAVFAAVLKRLLQEAIEVKSENDLTV